MTTRPPQDRPSAAEHVALRDYLARAGFGPADVDRLAGSPAAGRTRAEIAGRIRAALRELPKGA